MVKVGDYVKILDYEDREDYNDEEIEQIYNEVVGNIVKVVIAQDGDSWIELELSTPIMIVNQYGESIEIAKLFVLREWVVVV